LDGANWPASGNLFPSFGIPALLMIENTAPLPQAIVGDPYSATLIATGGKPPYSFSIISGSVPGLTMNSGGVVSGTPIGAAGTVSFTVEVTDSNAPAQSATATLSITIGPALSITTASLPPATKGSSYNNSVVANGGKAPYAFSVSSGSLPKGLSINATSGAISGTPDGTRGTANFTVQVTDSSSPSQTATANLSIKVH
jgi:hypothetical protein